MPPKESRFPVVNNTQQAEDSFDLVAARNLRKPTGVFGTVAYIIKGALGAGILGSHAAFANAGMVAIPITIALGIYMCICLHILVKSAQVIYKRTTIPKLSYSEVGEAAFAISPLSTFRKLSRPFRIAIDTCICLDLFGACCCYQLMISGTVKQIVENSQNTTVAGLTADYPCLKLYMVFILIPMIIICMVRQLDVLAKISIAGNVVVLLCVFATIYYSLKVNPSMSGMVTFTSFKGLFTYIGMIVFSMSCSGIVVSLEGNMRQPERFPYALVIGMAGITVCITTLAFFGYSAYGEHSKAPVTFHFPMELLPIILKIGIALMLYITHGVNFWVPFNLLFRYLQNLHSEQNVLRWEYVYRGVCCACITLLGIVFPSVNKLMSFLGAFCLSNMAFIFPALIYLAISWERPGLGRMKWRLISCILIIFIGLIMFSAGTYVSVGDLVALFGADDEKIDEIEEEIHPE